MTLMAFLIAGTMSVGPVSVPDLAGFRWQARPIVIFAAKGDPRLGAQLARFEAAEAELIERDNVVVVDTEAGSALRARFRPADFTVILVGLDGGEKFRRDGLVAPDELQALIDTMPMRRREMRESD